MSTVKVSPINAMLVGNQIRVEQHLEFEPKTEFIAFDSFLSEAAHNVAGMRNWIMSDIRDSMGGNCCGGSLVVSIMGNGLLVSTTINRLNMEIQNEHSLGFLRAIIDRQLMRRKS